MPLIASVLHLDRKDVKALRITDPYSLHRVVYSLYSDVRTEADKANSTPSGILYADLGGDFHGRKILLLANRPPESRIAGFFGEVQSREVPADFLDHTRYRFKVIINPTRRDNNTRKLMPVKGREAIADWFCSRSQGSWGFTACERHLQVDSIEVQRFSGKGGHQVTLCQAHLQGELLVQNPELFRKSFQQGIGRGRTFGCGLLQLVPLTDNLFD
ncbi:type I-E CRISPR-associated protein Cas6/Cse3/CasE [Endozoicomonas atrinae]|uniref:type I-E CRISPR-associated protein Cas6/Cse3/CasE n=1 Tax=Endozoicomonas atrinae TaxID=1333660 RepID=UPI003B00DD79